MSTIRHHILKTLDVPPPARAPLRTLARHCAGIAPALGAAVHLCKGSTPSGQNPLSSLSASSCFWAGEIPKQTDLVCFLIQWRSIRAVSGVFTAVVKPGRTAGEIGPAGRWAPPGLEFDHPTPGILTMPRTLAVETVQVQDSPPTRWRVSSLNMPGGQETWVQCRVNAGPALTRSTNINPALGQWPYSAPNALFHNLPAHLHTRTGNPVSARCLGLTSTATNSHSHSTDSKTGQCRERWPIILPKLFWLLQWIHL